MKHLHGQYTKIIGKNQPNILAQRILRCDNRQCDRVCYYEVYCETVRRVEKRRHTDADALAAHGRQDHFARLGELKAEFVDDTIIEKFEV